MIEKKIEALAEEFRNRLQKVTSDRVEEMKEDDNSHYLIYRVLGVSYSEGQAIDVYQNKGRFLYKYAGSFLEQASKLCFLETYPDSGSLRIPNTIGSKPATFEIDCLIGNDALEIKWKDATTDGDHITKEHTRIKVIAAAGYTPIRVMFYYPNRSQAIRIQETLQTLYSGIGGQYFHGDDAWKYVKKKTKVDLFGILENIADSVDKGKKK
jgi:type II restriction enzyme